MYISEPKSMNEYVSKDETISMGKIYSNLLEAHKSALEQMNRLGKLNEMIGGPVPFPSNTQDKKSSVGMLSDFSNVALGLQLTINEIGYQIGIIENRLFA